MVRSAPSARLAALAAALACLAAAAVAQAQPQQQQCNVPNIPRDDFSATQVAFLATELQAVLSRGCYSVAVTPECLAQFWRYICTGSAPGGANATFFAPHVAGVVERCLPQAAADLPVPVPRISCPVNETLLQQLLGVSLPSPALAGNGSAGLPVTAGLPGCTNEVPLPWPDFNGSLLFDSLLAFAQDVPQECLRTSIASLPTCYEDLTMQSGCCSLRCRAAVEQVPQSCFVSFLLSLCRRLPNLTKFFFSASRRCSSLNATCEGIDSGQAGSDVPLQGARVLPLVAASSGTCPLKQSNWANYNAVTVTTQTLRLLADASDACRQNSLPRISSACNGELGVEVGCCSEQCALVMRSVPADCNEEFRRLLCRQPDVAKYMTALASRCLGPDYYAC